MYSTIITPRVSETDGVGHINNTVLPAWFEAGRAGFFRLVHPSDSFMDWPLVVKTYTVTFDHEIAYGPDVTVECDLAGIGNSSVRLSERALQGGRVCARSEVVYVLVGGDRRPRPIPTDIRSALEEHLVKESNV